MTCRKCSSPDIDEDRWESADGAYVDYRYMCRNCKHVWWIDGPDA